MNVKQQQPVAVYDEDGTLIGDYLADLLVEDVLIIELKTAKTLAPEHEAQIRLDGKSAAKNAKNLKKTRVFPSMYSPRSLRLNEIKVCSGRINRKEHKERRGDLVLGRTGHDL
jgi:hypothetical protein